MGLVNWPEGAVVHGVYLVIATLDSDTVCAPRAGPWDEDWDKVTCEDCRRIAIERGVRL